MIIILFPDPDFKFAIEGVLLSIFAILGLIGNSLAIVVLSKPSMRSPINLILIGNIQETVQNSNIIHYLSFYSSSVLRQNHLSLNKNVCCLLKSILF